MPRSPSLGLLPLVALAACGTSGSAGEPAPRVPAHLTCSIAARASNGADVAIDVGADCGGTVTATLRVATGDPRTPRWSDVGSSGLSVGGTWDVVDGGLRRTVRVTNSGAEKIALVGLEWSFDVASLAADRFFHDGYQSWAYTGLEPVREALDEERGTFRHGGDPGDSSDERGGVGFWVGAALGKGGRGLVVGADGGTVFKTAVAMDGTRLRLLEGGDLEAIELAPGESRVLDGVFVSMGDVVGGLDAYGRAVAASHPPVRPRKRALGGWGSWNVYYRDISATKMRDEATYAAKELAPRGLTDFLLDDGYEPRWGEWTAKPELGASLEDLAREQSAAGLAPAIWLAPFVVDARAAVVAAHPEYFVGDGAGKPRILPIFGGNDMVVLDPTSDGARDHLKGQIEGLVKAGYKTFKLDFVYAGALPGVRKQPITALESYARLFQIVREAAGDAHLVGCGAPLLPTVSWVDSYRSGPDIAFELAPDPFYGFFLAQARHSALRAFTDHFWSLDPDVLLLRGARIDDAEAWTTTIATVMTGGTYLLGDPRQAGPTRFGMSVSPALLPFIRDGRAARPDDLDDAGSDGTLIVSPLFDGAGETAVPHVWRKTSADEKTELVAVFGWSQDPFEARVALAPGAEELQPDGTRAPAPADGRIRVARHQARLFVATKR